MQKRTSCFPFLRLLAREEAHTVSRPVWVRVSHQRHGVRAEALPGVGTSAFPGGPRLCHTATLLACPLRLVREHPWGNRPR